MCILFIHWTKHESAGYRLILASNRDEFFKRPTIPAHFWEKDPNIYAGKDQIKKGTWLGINKKSNRFAALLNIMGGTNPEKQSRGELITNFLSTTSKFNTTGEYLNEVSKKGDNYSLFNLIVGEIQSSGIDLKVLSNKEIWSLEPDRSYGFGNSPANQSGMNFEKVKYGREQFHSVIQEYNTKLTCDQPEREEIFIEKLLNILKSKQEHFPDPLLESLGTNIPKETLSKMSSLYSNVNNDYGTRNHTLIIVDKKNRLKYINYSMKEPIEYPANSEWIKRTEIFHLN